ncbi:hypothetical protein EIP91_007297 [Steccherinum ochraceum]|uniref:DUF6534 domain-containing protein n=1 Tax=Steccherinum ochraceum TaxID=92696 RepID=A0A4R0RA23_9APHY|nr:hypothetical protein EIP91_007297 [Steccherinum ochraceum]
MSALPSVDRFFGGFTVATCLSFILYGIVAVQVYEFILTCTKDPRLVKWVSVIVCVLETLQTSFLLHVLYHYLIRHFGDFEAAQQIVWTVPAAIATERAVVLVVQTYLLLRIWVLSNRSRVLVSFLTLLLAARIAVSIEFLYNYSHVHSWREAFNDHITYAMAVTTLVLGVVTDLALTMAFTYYLLRDRTGFHTTDSVLQSLVRFSVNTGGITFANSMVMLFTYVFVEDSLLSPGFISISSKLYANSFFAILNAGHKLRDRAALLSSYHTPGVQMRNLREMGRTTLRMGTPIDVGILQVQESDANQSQTVVIDGDELPFKISEKYDSSPERPNFGFSVEP